MTTAEIKETLDNCRLLARSYHFAKAETGAYRTSLSSGKPIRYCNDGGTHERAGNPVERSLCKLADMGTDCEKLSRLWKNRCVRAKRLIALARDDMQRDVLTMYYIQGMSWHEVARQKKISVRWVHKLHGYALLEISKST